MADSGALAARVLSIFSRRPDQDADAVSRGRQGLQCTDWRERADVRGAAHPRGADPARRLLRPVPLADAAELHQGLRRTLPGVVRPLSGAGGPMRCAACEMAHKIAI